MASKQIEKSMNRRIDPELDEIIQKLRKEGDLSVRQASRQLAKQIKGQRMKREEITF